MESRERRENETDTNTICQPSAAATFATLFHCRKLLTVKWKTIPFRWIAIDMVKRAEEL